MQILQWLSKAVQEQPKEISSTSPHFKKKNGHDQKAKSKDFTLFNCILLRRRDIAKTCFYSTLNLKRLGSFRRRQHWNHQMKLNKEDIVRGLGIGHKADLAVHGGNKVIPIGDTSLSATSGSGNDQFCRVEKKEKEKSEKIKSISRVKELWRWAANAKSEKGGKYIGRKVLHFRNRTTLKSVPDDDQLSNDSPKISFRWDLESCSTSSSAFSTTSMATSSKNDQNLNMLSVNSTPIHDPDQCISRTGNWITTDSEFVVLEL